MNALAPAEHDVLVRQHTVLGNLPVKEISASITAVTLVTHNAL
jgi:hypothetical protein